MNLQNVQTRDLSTVIKLNTNIAKRKAGNLPVDKLEAKLKSLVERSNSATDKHRITTENISIPAELPIAEKAEHIVGLIQDNQVVIVAGETGCGKTTQLPKLCAMAGLGARGLIAHTQPRRVAATSVARRIAEEMNCQLGETVGYNIRFNSKTSDQTRIKLMTDGVLLSEIESDPLLSRYEVIIIDEAHERSLNIDFLLGFVKKILEKRKDLKVIITSATIDIEKFSENFNRAPIVQVEGRSFPVEVRYRPLEESEDQNDDPLMGGVVNAVDECISESPGNILIFADGEGQIKSIIKKLKNLNLSQTELLPLYARLSVAEQQRIFKESGKRKIIVSTNVAETSLTVPGILFVIDIGTARISRFSQRNKIQQLPVEKISRASADQRKGRCGRIAPGICIRLYAEDDFNAREEFTPPEIRRTNLAAVVLKLKALRVGEVTEFPFLEAPTDRAWKVAFNSLFELGAINQDQEITPVGLNMARLPVDPQLARILVDEKLAAVEEMLIICSLMSVKEVRMRPHDKQQKADQLHAFYNKSDSDILTAINLWNELAKQRESTSSNQFKTWCSKNLINFLGWLEWRRVYSQLKEAVESLGIKPNPSAAHDDHVHSALIPGFITHIFQKTTEAHYQGARGLKVWLHPSSLQFKKRSPWQLSAEMIETEKLYARMNCPLKPEWIGPYAQHLVKNNYSDIHWSKKSGKVVAYLNQSLFGLPIVNRKPVNYASIDQQKSREIFLLEGLAKHQVSANFPFLSANKKKLDSLEETEIRQRTNNLKIDPDTLGELYNQVLPEHIVSLVSLQKWLKRDFKARNKQLTFTIEQLSNNVSTSNEDFPSTILVKGVELPLSYSFAPGSEEDGVSVRIPEEMLGQFHERDFDWLVPGYLPQKVEAAIKSLPKATRKTLIPIKDTANWCTQQLLEQATDGKWFVDELARVLQIKTGKQFKPSDFDLANLEPHLKMKFSLAKRKGSSHLSSSLKEALSKVAKPAKTHTTQSDKFYEWEFAKYELEKETTKGKVKLRIFQALADRQQWVESIPCNNLNQAISTHRQGIARLLMLEHKSKLNKAFNSWPDKTQFEKLCIRYGGFKSLFDAVLIAIGQNLVAKQLIQSEQEYRQVSKQFSSKVLPLIAEYLGQLLPLIKLREKLFQQLSRLNYNSFPDSIDDIKRQIKELWDSRTLQQIDLALIDDFVRYHKGAELRIKRINENYPKEKAAMEIWEEWHQWWLDLNTEALQQTSKEELNYLYWQLQEYRLSLFSPGIKTKTSISSKKLQSYFEALEDKL